MLALHDDEAFAAWRDAPIASATDPYAKLLPWATSADWDRLVAWAADRRAFSVAAPSPTLVAATREAAACFPKRTGRARAGWVYLLERDSGHPTTIRLGDVLVASVDHGAWVVVAAACGAALRRGAAIPPELGGLVQRILGAAGRPELLAASEAYRAGGWGVAATTLRRSPGPRAVVGVPPPGAPAATEAYLLALGLGEWLGLPPTSVDAVYRAAWLEERPAVEAWLEEASPAERLALRAYAEWAQGRAGARATEMRELWAEALNVVNMADEPRRLHVRMTVRTLPLGDALIVRAPDPLALPRHLDSIDEYYVLLHGWEPHQDIRFTPHGPDVLLHARAFGPRDVALLMRGRKRRRDAAAVLAAVLAEPADAPACLGTGGGQGESTAPPPLAFDYGGEGWPGEPSPPAPRWRRAARLAAAMRPYEQAADDRSRNRAAVRVTRRYLEWSWSLPALAVAIARQAGATDDAAAARLLAEGDAAAHDLAAGWCLLARYWPVADLEGDEGAFRAVLRPGVDVRDALAEASLRPGPARLANAAADLAEADDPQEGLAGEEGLYAYFWAIAVLPPSRGADLVLGIHVDFPRAPYAPPPRAPLDLPPWDAFCAELAATSGLPRGAPAQPDGEIEIEIQCRRGVCEVGLWASHAMRRQLLCDPRIPPPADRAWVADLA